MSSSHSQVQRPPPSVSGDLFGKVALITGASRGLGRAIAQHLAGCGASVALLGRDEASLAETVALCSAHGAPAACFLVDITEYDQVVDAVHQVLDRFGSIDILVNNAGITRVGSALELSPHEWDQVMRVNVYGAFYLCREVGRQMRDQGHGKVVNVASVMGLVGDAHLLPYVASKGALVQMTRGLAIELAQFNIQVNAVAPGYVRTDLNSEMLDDPKLMRSVLRRTPARRLGLPHEVAGAVHYLVGPGSDYVSGHVLVVDGGWTAQ